MNASSWTRLLLAAASAKLVLVLVLVAAFRLPVFSIFVGLYQTPLALDLLYAIVFGAAAGLLLFVGRLDRRAVSLGGFMLMVALAFCDRPLDPVVREAEGSLRRLSELLEGLRVDAFMAFFLWRFVREFPKAPTTQRMRRFLGTAGAVSAAIGIYLFTANLLLVWLRGRGWTAAVDLLSIFAPKAGEGWYHQMLMPLTALALPVLAVRARSAVGEERHRVQVFTAGLILGLAPALLEILTELLVNPYMPYMETHPEVACRVALFLALFSLSMPVSTTYAVLVRRVLGVRLIARRAMHYLLARYTVLALVAVPLVGLGIYLFMQRHAPLAEIFSGIRLLLLLGTAAIGLWALRHRKRLLDAIDRRFFREQYDARQILTQLVECIRTATDTVELAGLITGGIDRALHLEGAWLLVDDPKSGTFVDPTSRKRRLDASSHLVGLIFDSTDPLIIDLAAPRSPLAKLPEEERQWLSRAQLALIVPVVATDGTPLAIIGLGEKKSGLPFLKEDRQLLEAIANSAAMVLELQRMRAVAPTPARECCNCWRLFPSHIVFCNDHGQRLKPAAVPYVLPGKYRFERRIGTGGMGIVYRAFDLVLARLVAIKTLRRISPEDAVRLLHEARAAAKVAHPHLAAIYGVDFWQETPMLVLELLEGGTLTERVTRAVFSPRETVELGIAMAAALERLHGAGILHRDVKPSNIGYARDGTPKLMDFGIARFLYDLRPEPRTQVPGDEADEPTTSIWTNNRTEVTVHRQLVGTLSYLSPEALEGQEPNVSFDLWGLAIVLYECLLGKKIFGGDDQKQVMTRILMARIPDPAQVLPDLPPALAGFFPEALARDIERRPASAADFKARLARVASALPG